MRESEENEVSAMGATLRAARLSERASLLSIGPGMGPVVSSAGVRGSKETASRIDVTSFSASARAIVSPSPLLPSP
jgi:hypothetical protein